MKATFRKQLIATAVSVLVGSAAYAGGKSMDFQNADADGNGAVSFSEAQKSLNLDQKQFAKADADNNQQLDRSEFQMAAQWSSKDQQAAMKLEKGTTGQGETGKENTQGQPGDSKVAAGAAQGANDRDMKSGQGDTTTTDKSRSSDGGAAITQQSTVSSALMAKQVDDIKGMNVKNQNGAEVGEVDKVVVNKQTNKLYAVVSVGGLLGIGDKLIPMGLEQMELRDDELILPTSMTEDQLKTHQAYNDSQYMELKDDQQIGQVISPSSSGTSSADRFANADRDNDGRISKEEATNDASMAADWDKIDRNKDKSIDRAEFSAFEKSSE